MEMRKPIKKITEKEKEIIGNIGLESFIQFYKTPLPYSLKPKQFIDNMGFITHPGVKFNMYLITTTGIIYNSITGEQLTNYDRHNGYLAVTLQTYGGSKVFSVHRLVAYQFCNPPEDFASGKYNVNHIDGDKYNNFSNNLEWITVAANNQHARVTYSEKCNTAITNGAPVVKESFVRRLCEEFVKGKSNTEIMREFGLEIGSANHSLLRDIRGGYTWYHITKEYNFERSSKKHSYSKEERENIKNLILEGKNDREIFAIMNGREYIASLDRLNSPYKSIFSIRDSIRKNRQLR